MKSILCQIREKVASNGVSSISDGCDGQALTATRTAINRTKTFMITVGLGLETVVQFALHLYKEDSQLNKYNESSYLLF
jgi:hypothetical protein